MNKETGGSAFPNHTLEPNPNGGEPRIIWQEGMTLRDYFAAKALHGLMVPFLQQELDTQDPSGWMDGLAMDAYSLADAMLKAREQ